MFTEEQRGLRAAVRDFLGAACPPAPRTPDAGLWRRFAVELGVAGLAIPEEYGGAGCGFAEVAIVCEELGRTLTPFPYLSTVVLAANLADDRLREEIAAGAVVATVALDGEFALAGNRLSGRAPYVLDGHTADAVLIAVGDEVVRAEPTTRQPYVTLDLTRPLAALTFSSAPVTRVGRRDVRRVRDLAIAALAAEQAGGASRCLEMAVDYAKERVQFGRPIGSFQAIKHKLADVLLRVESARSAVYEAARVADLEPSRLPSCAAMAGSYCSEAYLLAAGENIQVHGGIGVTWEHQAHLYFKRATADAQLFGRPEAHRARLAQLLLADS